MRDDMGEEKAFSPDLAELLQSIDQEINQALLQHGDGLKDRSDDQKQELGRHICFELGNKNLALPLSLVVEVGELENVRPLPFLPGWVQGVTNIRGEIVSVTNIALFLNIAQKQQRKAHPTFIVIYNGQVKTAIIVDRIAATRMLYHNETIKEDKTTEQGILSNFLTGSAMFYSGEKEEVVQLVDGEQLLSSIKI
jgi:purine-binding chemotaxis protein CheW